MVRQKRLEPDLTVSHNADDNDVVGAACDLAGAAEMFNTQRKKQPSKPELDDVELV
jgi:hypothetical protein